MSDSGQRHPLQLNHSRCLTPKSRPLPLHTTTTTDASAGRFASYFLVRSSFAFGSLSSVYAYSISASSDLPLYSPRASSSPKTHIYGSIHVSMETITIPSPSAFLASPVLQPTTILPKTGQKRKAGPSRPLKQAMAKAKGPEGVVKPKQSKSRNGMGACRSTFAFGAEGGHPTC